ncbi:plasmid stabilization protein [Acidithiobacillus marinus]|uniref:Plasmid stabilization protein n=1 Tax=Acidithiobacillus marinus TaxID=187490 RepID=A0A2I1DJR6_9PROT|nr:type II toxin-antitoxin system RelE/ParE family toxin [Acidithiobacillus marinus]PKY10114.1 plasmid stabilization protein [Acidithiobacillus marinus]
MTKRNAPYRIVWRPQAEADLENIMDYIAQGNPRNAELFGQALRDKTLLLAQYPMMGHSGRPYLPSFIRELVVHRNYIVFYRVLDDADMVEILRVKHAAQQIP